MCQVRRRTKMWTKMKSVIVAIDVPTTAAPRLERNHCGKRVEIYGNETT